MRIVAVLNQKGGVGKTTTAVNLGAALALRGRRVLLIDADPQGNLTDHLGLEPGDEDATLYDVLTDGLALADATLETETEGLFVVPSEPDLAAAESELAGELGREGRLAHALKALPADAYDWVLIDCPPSLGLLSINAMAAASELLITLQTEYFALKGLAALNDVIAMVRQHVNPELALLGILPTLVNPVTLLSKEVIEEVRVHYGDVVFGTRIRQNVSLAEAPSRGAHIFNYRPSSRGAADYLRLADEIEGRRDARNRSHATRVATSKRKQPGLTRADAPAEPPAPESSGPAPERTVPAPEEGAPAPESTASRVQIDDVDTAPEASVVAPAVPAADDAAPLPAPSRTTSTEVAPTDRGVGADLGAEVGYRTPPPASALATPEPVRAQDETPMPPPEPLRTPALEPDMRVSSKLPTTDAPVSAEIRAAAPDPAAPSAPATPTRVTPVVMPAATAQPTLVRETTVEVAERPVASAAAPAAKQLDVGEKPKTGPVEMDADEARDWFRRAMARRENT